MQDKKYKNAIKYIEASAPDASQTLVQSRYKVNKVTFKWTPKNENELEEILIRRSFNFKQAAKDFQASFNR